MITEKIKVFTKELAYIKDNDLKESTEILLDKVPDYFYTVPAASTGKYHPEYAQGTGGLLRHTKAALRIAYELLSLNCYDNVFNKREKDLIIISIMFHDCIKKGIEEEKYTRFDHPLLACEFIKSHQSLTKFTNQDIEFLSNAISSHMGQWNTNEYSKIVLPVPLDKYQIFVHTCDYLSSKKFLTIQFDNNEIID